MKRTDLPARTFFFWPIYGWLIPLGPILAWVAFSHRRLATLGAAAAVLTLLGLGGTTSLPKVLFGSNWAWLTYDRFALWAGLCWLPLAGLWWTVMECRARERGWPGQRTPEGRRGLAALLTAGAAGVALFSASLSIYKHSQPPELDLKPIADFLAAGDRKEWRYFTFGFGDQLARLSILTSATTPDGSYHTARTLPVLKQSGIGQIDGAVWSDRGVEGAYVFLERAEQWGVRWAFVNHHAYLPLLKAAEWQFRERLSNEVEVWELKPVPPRARDIMTERRAGVTLERLWWGAVPLLLLFVAVLFLAQQLRCRRTCSADGPQVYGG